MEWQITATVFALAGLCLWLIRAIPVCASLRHARHLRDVKTTDRPTAEPPPLVSVIVPARDEEAAIERCLESLAAQDYPNLEVIAVDDRSTDSTGGIMDHLAARHRRIRVVHVADLPSGWLGKNHANRTGAARARGDWLLFTDGDVFFQPDTVRLAIRHAQNEALDHLCLFPGLVRGGFWERAMCTFFMMALVASCRAWQVRDPLRPEAFFGVGAFNRVRRRAYEQIGTHRRLRLEVADDVKLGKLLKQNGFVSDGLVAWPHLTLRWHVGLRGVVRGLEKNAFCATDYRVGQALVGAAVLLAAAAMPILGTVLAPGWARLVFAAWFGSEVAALGYGARKQNDTGWLGIAFPVVSLTTAYTLMRSMVLTLARGGVQWRGTFYRLADLRREMI